LFRTRRVDEHVGPLAEYTALRAEVDKLQELLWKVMSFQITTAGATFGFSLSSGTRAPLLLIVPFSSYMLMARWALYRRMMSRVADYITEQLEPRVPGGLRWERWIRDSRDRYRIPHLLWVNPVALMFPGVSLLAVAAVAGWLVWLHRWTSTGLIVGIAVAIAATLGLMLAILSAVLVYRTLRSPKSS
jgi:hypothetical protein